MQQNNQVVMQAQNHTNVNVQAFAAKYQSKRECYKFLTIQVEAYLPPYENVTIYFLKDVISGTKKCKYPVQFCVDRSPDIKAKQVRTIVIPSYEGLTLKDMDEHIFRHNQGIFEYFPDEVEIQKTPKHWICNVAATVLGDTYIDWVKSQIENRNQKVTKDKDLNIAMDPDIAAAFQASTAVSRKCLL